VLCTELTLDMLQRQLAIPLVLSSHYCVALAPPTRRAISCRQSSFWSGFSSLLSVSKQNDDTISTEEDIVKTNNNTTTRQVGIFIDLDNFSGDFPVDRSSVTRWIQPLRRFGDTVGTITALRAFANQYTTTYKQQETNADPSLNDPWDDEIGFDDSRDDEFQFAADVFDPFDPWEEYSYEDGFDGGVAQTGYDETGILRCGICGQKMKLSKKDIAKGWDEYDKLDKHMRSLHDNEQAKRKNRLEQVKKKSGKKANKLMKGKFGDKYRKYNQAQVGLDRSTKNDLFQILKEEGVSCVECKDVDYTLVKQAKSWLKKVGARNPLVLVVVSKDSDFRPLLKAARKPKFGRVSVIAAPGDEPPSFVSDIVLTGSDNSADLQAKAYTMSGESLFEEFGLANPTVFSATKEEDEAENDTTTRT
jgi:hypothetical protein